VLIGLDAFDPELAAQWAAAGELPALARLFERGARAPVHNPVGVFVGAVWVNFASCLRPDRHRFHCWDEIDPRDYEWRLRSPDPDYDSFWKRIGDSGRRVAAVDVPHSRTPHAINGVEVNEWGCHDRHFGLHSSPVDRTAQLVAAHGLHPVYGIESYAARDFAPDDLVHRRGRYRTIVEERALLEELKAGAITKGEILQSLAREESWDLLVGVFGESHAVGHQQYHLHDRSHPRFDSETQQRLGGDPLLQVYREIDAALGRLLDFVSTDALVLVHLSHGMTVHNDGTHLLDEVLALLDQGSPKRSAANVLRKIAQPAAPELRRLATAWRVPASARRFLGQWLRAGRPRHRAGRRFFMAPNNSVYGGVRLNLAGREPRGRVEPNEVEELCRTLERDLLELINVATGKPAILAVIRSDAHHIRHPDDTMPDLFIEWDRSAPIETVLSPKTGMVRTAYTGSRSGDHRPDGLLLAMGPDFAAGAEFPAIRVEDIGPSIAARLGTSLEDVDGAVITWLSGSAGHPKDAQNSELITDAAVSSG